MTTWCSPAWVALLAAACATGPRDPFRDAESAMARHDLAGALQALDTVPVAHLRYPEARAAAVAVERNMRRCHELILEALMLRAEWRDREALEALQRARGVWPGLPGIDVLIRATNHRLQLLGAQTVAMGIDAPPAAPQFEPGGRSLVVVEAPSPHASEPALPEASRPAMIEDAVAIGLVAVESRLGRGELEAAVGELFALAALYPRDARVRIRLVRVLHQRALLRYGQGAVSAAISDWKRVLEIDPRHEQVRRLLAAAEAEERER